MASVASSCLDLGQGARPKRVANAPLPTAVVPELEASKAGGGRMAQNLSDLREQWRDPLLTVLTILLALLMFVLAPLRAEQITGAQELGFALVALVTGAVLVLSGKRFAIWALLTASLLAAIAAVHRLYYPGRSLVLVEAMIGQLYPATLLARLVTLEVEDSGRV
jgi:hypothetical protein